MKTRTAIAVVATFFLLVWSELAKGEVSIDGRTSASGYSLASGGADGNPWPWLRPHFDPSWILNAGGAENGDGMPSFDVDPLSGYPAVTWAWFDGHDFEIVVARWTGDGWGPWESITNNDVDDLGPAVAFDESGAMRITWWRLGSHSGEVWFAEKPVRGEGASEELVTDVANGGHGGTVASTASRGDIVAYQRNGSAMREIVVSRRDRDWDRTVIAATSYAGPRGDGDLDVTAHARGELIWIDWVDGEGEVAYSTYQHDSDTWSSPLRESYSWDPEDGGREYWEREGARVRIRLRLLR